MRFGAVVLAVGLVVTAGCGVESLAGRDAKSIAGRSNDAPVVVDTVAPIAEALESFRADVPATDRLQRGATSAPALLAEIQGALAARDTAALERITLDRAEFAYLYYPDAPIARPPYELPPSLAWFRMQQENRTAVLRLLRELGGEELHDAELVCATPPVEQGANRIHRGCVVRTGGREVRMFGSLLERDGAFKVLSWANDF